MTTWSKRELSKDDTNGCAQVDWGKTQETSTLHQGRNPTPTEETRERERWLVLPSKKHTSLLSSFNWSALKTRIQVTLYKLRRLYL